MKPHSTCDTEYGKLDIEFPLLFPRCLYGDAMTTCAGWRTLMKKAWTSDWETVINGTEMMSVHSHLGEILVSDAFFGISVRRYRLWRLFWIPHFYQGEIGTIGKRDIKRRRDFVLSGMRWPWYAIALLQPENLFPWLAVEPGFRRTFAPAMLRMYVRWLPEALHLRPRLCCGRGNSIQQLANPADGYDGWPMLWGSLLGLVAELWKIRPQHMDALLHKAGHDAIRLLLDEGILELADGRFLLRE